MRKVSGSRILLAAVCAFGLFFFTGMASADPVAFQGVGASCEKLANGNYMLHFTVRVAVNVTPLEFNYHWERSDGAKSGMQIWSVKPGTTSIPVMTTWELGAQWVGKKFWEKLFVNTGNTHLESREVGIVVK